MWQILIVKKYYMYACVLIFTFVNGRNANVIMLVYFQVWKLYLLNEFVGAVRAMIGERPKRIASALETYDGKQNTCDVSFGPVCKQKYTLHCCLLARKMCKTIKSKSHVVAVAVAVVVGIGFAGFAVCLLIICCGVVCLHTVSYTHLTLPTNREV